MGYILLTRRGIAQQAPQTQRHAAHQMGRNLKMSDAGQMPQQRANLAVSRRRQIMLEQAGGVWRHPKTF